MSLPYNSYHTGAEVDAAVDRANALWLISGTQLVGTSALGNSVSGGSVVLPTALTFNPLQIFLQIESPVGGLVMFAVLVAGTLTTAGFDFDLSNTTDSTQYKLHYLILGELIGGGSSGGSSES